MRAAAFAAIVAATSANALMHGIPAPQIGPPSTDALGPTYSRWPVGVLPIIVWRNLGNDTEATLAPSNVYPNSFAATAGIGATMVADFQAPGGAGYYPGNIYGVDDGSMAAAKANGLYFFTSTLLDWTQNTGANSVASNIAIANNAGSQSYMVGYIGTDEPNCSGPGFSYMDNLPTAIATVKGYDPTRVFFVNHVHNYFDEPQFSMDPHFGGCGTALAAIRASAFVAMDNYPLTNAYDANPGPYPAVGLGKSDFLSVSNDALYLQGINVQGMIYYAAPGQPVLAYNETGTDNLGVSEVSPNFPANTNSTTTLTNTSGWMNFTSAFVGMAVSGPGIPAGDTIVSVTNATTATMATAATATATNVTVTLGSGALADCVPAINLCLAHGNEYRGTSPEVAAEYWMSAINGATGFLEFVHDTYSYRCALGYTGNNGAVSSGSGCDVPQKNMTKLNGRLRSYGPVIMAKTVGLCSMDGFKFTPTGVAAGPETYTNTCNGGDVKLSGPTLTAKKQGTAAVIVKAYNGYHYVMVQPSRRAPTSAGFTYTVQLNDGSFTTARVDYDTNADYDTGNDTTGSSVTLTGGNSFTVTLGANGDNYQTKIIQVQ